MARKESNCVLGTIAALISMVLQLSANEEADRIVALPGQPAVGFHQFSGYVTVNELAGRALFYWLTEAVDQPLTRPLVIWLNGGPGCSSVGYGASEEIGPFRINKTSYDLYLNKFSWNKLANLIFLETPAGVGFSYSNRSSDFFDTGDVRTAKDSLQFLIRWLDRFPRYKNREIYLTGESYAGHYVPQLAREIVNYNKKTNHKINLKGFMVGNALIDDHYDSLGMVDYFWSHAMISDKTYKQQSRIKCGLIWFNISDECHSVYYSIYHEIGTIDIFNIYAPTCETNVGSSTRHARHPNSGVFRQLMGYDPCIEDYAEIYYNRPDVQKALHANITGHIPYKWTACSGMDYYWNDTERSMLPIYRELIAAGLRIWVYSGDVDASVPVTSTRYSLAQLNLDTTIPWYPWYVNKQVGGRTEVYKGLTFATIKGAGHEVPMFKPRAAFQLFRSFLQGKPLPKS